MTVLAAVACHKDKKSGQGGGEEPGAVGPGGAGGGGECAQPVEPGAATAPVTYALPELCSGVDLRALTPSGAFAAGRGRKPERTKAADLSDFVLDPCPLAVPALRHATGLKPDIDGDLADWGGEGLVALDRQGDGIDGDAHRDLVALRFAEDADYYYAGFETAETFSSGAAKSTTYVLVFSQLTESDDGLLPKRYRDFAMGDGWFLEDYTPYGGKSAPVPAEKGEFAFKGKTAELKLSKAYFADLGSRFSVQLFAFDASGGKIRYDFVGAYVAGYEADYTCAAQMPDGHTKYFTFSRDVDIKPEDSESIYRATVEAAQEVESVMGAPFAAADSIPVVMVDHMLSNAAHIGGTLIQVEAGFWSQQAPSEQFSVMAHEYAHGYNHGDYLIDGKAWLFEGHSEWVRLAALRSFFGDEAAKSQAEQRRTIVVDTEKDIGVKPLTTIDPFTTDPAGHAFFNYSKAYLLYEQIGKSLTAEEIAKVLDYRLNGGGARGFDEAEVRAGFETALKAKGLTVDWRGWLDAGAYGGTAFAPPGS